MINKGPEVLRDHLLLNPQLTRWAEVHSLIVNFIKAKVEKEELGAKKAKDTLNHIEAQITASGGWDYATPETINAYYTAYSTFHNSNFKGGKGKGKGFKGTHWNTGKSDYQASQGKNNYYPHFKGKSKGWHKGKGKGKYFNYGKGKKGATPSYFKGKGKKGKQGNFKGNYHFKGKGKSKGKGKDSDGDVTMTVNAATDGNATAQTHQEPTGVTDGDWNEEDNNWYYEEGDYWTEDVNHVADWYDNHWEETVNQVDHHTADWGEDYWNWDSSWDSHGVYSVMHFPSADTQTYRTEISTACDDTWTVNCIMLDSAQLDIAAIWTDPGTVYCKTHAAWNSWDCYPTAQHWQGYYSDWKQHKTDRPMTAARTSAESVNSLLTVEGTDVSVRTKLTAPRNLNYKCSSDMDDWIMQESGAAHFGMHQMSRMTVKTLHCSLTCVLQMEEHSLCMDARLSLMTLATDFH